MSETQKRSIREVAIDIRKEWTKPYFGAVPYLEAMHDLRTPNDMYGQDDARGIVRYFLANANTFRGDKARALKAELTAIISPPKKVSESKPKQMKR